MTFHPGEGHAGCTTDWISLLLYNNCQSSNVKVCLWRNVTFPSKSVYSTCRVARTKDQSKERHHAVKKKERKKAVNH